MTYTELCHSIAKSSKTSADQVRIVIDGLVAVLSESMLDGDEVKIKGLGTFYAKNYFVAKGDLEFGSHTDGGERRRIRFRPFDSTNQALTAGMRARREAVKKRA